MASTTRSRRTGPASPFFWVVAVVAAFFLARGFLRQSQQAELPANAFFEVKRGDLLISVVEDGALRAVNEVVIRNPLEGLSRIITLAPEGAHIKKGELLAELDCSELKDKLNQQELSYQDNLFLYLQAQENLKIQKSLIESRIKAAELAVELAQSDLEKYRDGDAPKQLKAAEAQIQVLKEQVRIASERFNRTQELHKTENATRTELEADSLTLKRQQLNLAQAQEDMRLLAKFDQPNNVRILETNVQQAKDELERLKQRSAAEIAQAEADLKTSQRALEVTDESIKQQKKNLEGAKILAPQDGLVVYASASPFQGRSEGGMGGEGGRGRGHGGGDSSMGFMFDSGSQFRRGGGRSRSREGSSSSSYSSGGQSGSASSSAAAGGASAGAASSGGLAGGTGGSGGGGGGSLGGGGSQGGESASYASYRSVRQSSSFNLASSGSSSGGSYSSGSSSASLSGASSAYGSYGQSSGSFGGSSQTSSRYGSQSSAYDQMGFGIPSWSTVIEEGATVRQRQELIKLPDVSRMLAEVKVPEARVRQVFPGMPAFVRVETLPGRLFKGSVRKVGILPDAQASWLNPNNKVYATEVLIEDQLPELKPGVSARAEIIITNLPKVLSVPIQTVARLKGEHVCWVKKGPTVAPVAVTTGWFNDRFMEITSGLKEGDRVLLAPEVEPEEIETENAGESTNQVDSTQGDANEPRGRRSSNRENGTVEAGGMRSDAPAPAPTTPDGDSPGARRGRGQTGDNSEASGGGGRRGGRRGNDPEMQRLREEFMKLTPEEREARMREFRGRRGQGSGRGQTNAGPPAPAQEPNP